MKKIITTLVITLLFATPLAVLAGAGYLDTLLDKLLEKKIYLEIIQTEQEIKEFKGKTSLGARTSPGGEGGASSLSALDDTSITSASEGEILNFDGSEWINTNTSTGPINISTGDTEALKVGDTDNALIVDTVNNQILANQGSADNPGLSFQNKTGTGFYQNGNNLAWSLLGQLKGYFGGSAIRASVGTDNTPTYSSMSDVNSGINISGDTVRIITGGARRVQIGTTYLAVGDFAPTSRLSVSLDGGSDDAFHLSTDDSNDGDLLRIDSNGLAGFSNEFPSSTIQAGVPLDNTNHYMQMDVTSTAPIAADCDEDAEAGRFILHQAGTGTNDLYVCTGASDGWDTTTLSD